MQTTRTLHLTRMDRFLQNHQNCSRQFKDVYRMLKEQKTQTWNNFSEMCCFHRILSDPCYKWSKFHFFLLCIKCGFINFGNHCILLYFNYFTQTFSALGFYQLKMKWNLNEKWHKQINNVCVWRMKNAEENRILCGKKEDHCWEIAVTSWFYPTNIYDYIWQKRKIKRKH